MHSRRAILLASTALVGIGSVVMWQGPASAAGNCTADSPSKGTVTCIGPTDKASDISATILTEPTPDVALVITSADTVTLDTNVQIPETYDGTVSITNNGKVGTGTAPESFGLLILGSALGTDNNATITNNNVVTGFVSIDPVGGTGTIVNTSTIGSYVNLESVGDALLDSTGGTIVGTVNVNSSNIIPTVTVDDTVTTTETDGGFATAILGDVGTAKGTKSNYYNPDGFVGNTSSISGIDGASVTLTGHSGDINVQSYNEIDVTDTGTPSKDSGGNTVLTTMESYTRSGGPVDATVAAGAQ
jgi:hypothetical protein